MMLITALREAEEHGLDVFFFGTREARAAFATTMERETCPFEETVIGFTLLCLAVARRPRPVIAVVG